MLADKYTCMLADKYTGMCEGRLRRKLDTNVN